MSNVVQKDEEGVFFEMKEVETGKKLVVSVVVTAESVFHVTVKDDGNKRFTVSEEDPILQ